MKFGIPFTENWYDLFGCLPVTYWLKLRFTCSTVFLCQELGLPLKRCLNAPKAQSAFVELFWLFWCQAKRRRFGRLCPKLPVKSECNFQICVFCHQESTTDSHFSALISISWRQAALCHHGRHFLGRHRSVLARSPDTHHKTSMMEST